MTYGYPPENQPKGQTQPLRRVPGGIDQYQPVRTPPPETRPVYPQRRPARGSCGCLTAFFLLLLLVTVAAAVVLLAPVRTNFVILGVDRPIENTDLSRTDTMILTSIIPLKPEVHMLSIPRDLWVNIDGVGEQRINTAHYFAEAAQPGTGADAAVKAVRDNFGVSVRYYLSVKFDGVVQIVNAMGGLDLDLEEATAGYEAGHYHLDGDQALAFVRSRRGADDFYRMANAQLFIRAAAKQMMAPRSWARIPAVTLAAMRVIDTNLPPWELARVGLAMLRGFVSGIDSRTFTREMVTPFQTSGGADVLLPNWEMINPVLMEMFGE